MRPHTANTPPGRCTCPSRIQAVRPSHNERPAGGQVATADAHQAGINGLALVPKLANCNHGRALPATALPSLFLSNVSIFSNKDSRNCPISGAHLWPLGCLAAPASPLHSFDGYSDLLGIGISISTCVLVSR